MLYVLICQDKPNSSELRQSVRPKHLEYLGTQEVRFAGPMLTDDQSAMVGSIVFIVAESLAEAQTIADNDPYYLAGLFENVSVRPFKQAIPAES
ncbi:MAG: hypothetical protein ACI883_000974 [Candidatus Azotimanducaceae bacterium]|jgi:uncharacterized protein YciI|tara:strand:+ start:2195 stop:2476 length:282 start_codon:yes stop_codon:yes gene_type:complete